MLKVLLKILAIATSHSRFHFVALAPAVLLFCKTRYDFQRSTFWKFQFRSMKWTKALTCNSCLQCFLQALFGNDFILHRTQRTDYLASRDRRYNGLFFFRLLHHFDYPKFQWFLFNLLPFNVEMFAFSQLVQK